METKTITGLDVKIQEMAARIRDLREIKGFTTAEMAERTDTTEEEYISCESGLEDEGRPADSAILLTSDFVYVPRGIRVLESCS